MFPFQEENLGSFDQTIRETLMVLAYGNMNGVLQSINSSVDNIRLFLRRRDSDSEAVSINSKFSLVHYPN